MERQLMLTLIRNITAAFFKLKYVYIDEYLYEDRAFEGLKIE